MPAMKYWPTLHASPSSDGWAGGIAQGQRSRWRTARAPPGARSVDATTWGWQYSSRKKRLSTGCAHVGENSTSAGMPRAASIDRRMRGRNTRGVDHVVDLVAEHAA